MRRGTFALAFLVSLGAPSSVWASEVAEMIAAQFQDVCVSNMPSAERVRESAKARSGEQQSGSLMMRIFPEERTISAEYWIVQDRSPFQLALSLDESNSAQLTHCTLIQPFAPASAVTISLSDRLQLQSSTLDQKSSQGRLRAWSVKIGTRDVIITSIESEQDTGVVLSIRAIN